MVSAVMVLATACSSATSSPTPNATDSLGTLLNRERALILPFVQCLAQHDVTIWDKADGDQNIASLGAKDGWYKNSRALNNTAFSNFFEDIEGAYPTGPDFKPDNTVDGWINNAASTGKWPKVCGPVPSVG
jgi:hypothetical protein